MIIDFHTHIFPDKIAGPGRAADYLSDIFGASPFADGTHTGLCDSMKKAGVDVSVSLPAVTKYRSRILLTVCICFYRRGSYFIRGNPSGM